MKRPFANVCLAKGCPYISWGELESKRTPGNTVRMRICGLANTPPTYLMVCPRKDKEEDNGRIR